MMALVRRGLAALLFLVVGAPAGGACLVLAGWVGALTRAPDRFVELSGGAVIFLPFAMIGALWFAFLPALATGVAAVVSAGWIRGWPWILSTTAVGAASAFFMVSPDLAGALEPGFGGRVMLAAAGAAGGFVCALWLARRARRRATA